MTSVAVGDDQQRCVPVLVAILTGHGIDDYADLGFLKKVPDEKLRTILGTGVDDKMMEILRRAMQKCSGSNAIVHQLLLEVKKDVAARGSGEHVERPLVPLPHGTKRQLDGASGPGRRAPPSMRERMLADAGGRLGRHRAAARQPKGQ